MVRVHFMMMVHKKEKEIKECCVFREEGGNDRRARDGYDACTNGFTVI
jgi:hypothetical protein